jgi:hypothetical protein
MKELLDLKERHVDLKETLRDIFDLDLSVTDDIIQKRIKETYEQSYKDKTFTIEQYVFLLSGLGQYREYYSWLIGDILIKIDDKIKGGEISFRSLNDFIENYGEDIGMGKSNIYYCKSIRERFQDFDTFLKIGIKKAAVLITVKDEKDFKRLTEKVVNNELSAAQVRDMVVTYNTKKYEQQKEEKQIEQKTINKKYKYNVSLKSNKVIIQAQNFNAEYIVKALYYYEKAIKNYIDKCKENKDFFKET